MGSPCRTLVADRGDDGLRIDLVLRRHLADVRVATRTRIQSWIASGLVSANGVPVRRPAARVADGDVVRVALPAFALPPAMAAQDLAIDVLYEDDDLVVVNKPAGMVVHPTYGHSSRTVMNALLWRAADWPAPQRPSIVGRLDKDTSGLVVVARTRGAHAALQRALGSDRAEKQYLALVYGRVRTARGVVGLRLARDPGDRRRVIASADRGAESLTTFERLARVPAAAAGLALLRCRLVTGRMHQIRVHLAARGWPIVGDATYGDARWRLVHDPPLAAALAAFPRQALHAWRVAFDHPFTGKRLEVEAPVPGDLAGLMEACNLVIQSFGHLLI